VSRREAILAAVAVFVVALVVRAWAMSQITFPRPEDVAYYVGVSRNLVEGRGLVTDAIWSFQTPPLSFPRPAFEVWLPLPSLLAAVPMALFGTTFAVAQLSSVIVGSLVCVLAWRLAADVAVARLFPMGRARTFAVGTGLACAVYLPLVHASVQPDSTMPFAALVLVACLLITRFGRRISLDGAQDGIDAFVTRTERLVIRRSRVGLALAVVLGLAAMTRNEAAWLALTFALIEWSNVREAFPRWSDRLGAWGIRVIPVAFFAFFVFAPWALRDWVVFGSPFPGQALTNALSLEGKDIFAWQDEPTLSRYLAAGVPRLLELRWIGFVHNVKDVLVLLGIPLSIIGLIGLPDAWRSGGSTSGGSSSGSANPLRPLILFSAITFAVATLVFPVSTTWGTFLHAAGAIHVLLVLSALLALDRLIVWIGRKRGWTNPVAWLGPAFGIAGCVLFSSALVLSDGAAARETAATYESLAAALEDGSAGIVLSEEPGPVISDFPIWLAEATRHPTLALPNEPPASVLDLAGSFDPPARLLIVGAESDGVWPAAILSGAPTSECFVPLTLPDPPDHPGALDDILAFRIRC
jgi:hypothetical protein